MGVFQGISNSIIFYSLSFLPWYFSLLISWEREGGILPPQGRAGAEQSGLTRGERKADIESCLLSALLSVKE
jgi:hypothetical protein